MSIRHLFGAACAALVFAAASASAHEIGEKVTPIFQHAIPNLPGKSMVNLVVEYPPAAASPAHTHAKTAFIFAYVLSGEIESKVDNAPAKIYRAGDSWYEDPGAVHSISRNASKNKPARLLAVFVVDTDDKALVIPVK
jgi:quercetin dioxygenase-like cupin family protein